MDQLQNKVQNLSLYDVKSALRKAQNIVMNYTEMEAKVREATNNEPWGASSTMMQEIAAGTFNYGEFNEIMSMIYRRFTEKSVEEWRQIYKALQLLEFLVKNGSERVVDDARAHQATIKMLRSFYYVDDKMRDQGVNVRNRAKELVELLNDSDRLRTERKKSRQTRDKYTGRSNDGGFGGTGLKYGGFGSDTVPSSVMSSGYQDSSTGGPGSSRYPSARRIYGDGGVYGSDRPGRIELNTTSSRRIYGDGGGFDDADSISTDGVQADPVSLREAYSEYDENEGDSSHRRQASSSGPAADTRKDLPSTKKAEAEPVAAVDLFDFGDDSAVAAPASSTAASSAMPSAAAAPAAADDDFDDFQSAVSTTVSPKVAQKASEIMTNTDQKPSTSASADFFGVLSSAPLPSGAASTQSVAMSGLSSPPLIQRQPNSAVTGPNYSAGSGMFVSQSTATGLSPAGGSTAKPSGGAAAGGDLFSNIWSTARSTSSSSGGGSGSAGGKGGGMSMAQLAQQQSQKNIWGQGTSASRSQNGASSSPGGGGDLLF